MSAAAEFEVPKFGDDALMPGRRAWLSVPLTVMLWALIFTAVYFATRNIAIEDSVAAGGYIGALLITFIITIFFVIPATTLLLGTVIDEATKRMPGWRAGVTFSIAGLILGAVPAVFIYMVNNAYGWLPFTQLVIPSALAPWVSRILLEPTLRSRSLEVFAIVFTVIVVIGSLSIGVSVFTGRI
jgi:hypothetical protein